MKRRAEYALCDLCKSSSELACVAVLRRYYRAVAVEVVKGCADFNNIARDIGRFVVLYRSLNLFREHRESFEQFFFALVS